ncbi:hypothetical protein [Amycolatopsis sp. WQ 127309]|uniref:hypothetical protein n=1 Tax=Amycolatopsis sp. WQ 127309 TaxID=2932773 RepID=UPI001FF53BF1|nr:hypothetical protein [Amycolatopsis sp. WQ 127309]UOZ02413.1 hypothetical protein MUY22_26425 [Amycolatopsis sp. WQ 127309]
MNHGRLPEAAMTTATTPPGGDVSGWDRTAGVLHLAFATVFFLSLACFCLRLVPRDGEHSEQRGAFWCGRSGSPGSSRDRR